LGLFDKIKEPVFLKEYTSAEAHLAALQELAKTANGDIVAKIEQDIKNINAGLFGESNVMFELKNSHMPMCVLRDLYLEHNGLSAQIDFLIITRKRFFVIECKNLYGNVEVNHRGEFTRILDHKKREGIYSPITQNLRHLELIKQMRLAEKGNPLTKALFEKYFYENYRPIVVLANPKTILNARYAQREVKNQIIRADQLVSYIHAINSESGAMTSTEAEMMSLAQYFLEQHKENPVDYTEKYHTALKHQVSESSVTQAAPSADAQLRVLCPKCGAAMIRRKAAKGPNAGRDFYGCSNYPKCKGSVNVEPNLN
jgi:Zn-finger domain associated with topoisomerase type I